jgi:hypothetical protein
MQRQHDTDADHVLAWVALLFGEIQLYPPASPRTPMRHANPV